MAALIDLPSEYSRLRSISFYDLLKKTGYFDVPDEIGESALVEGFRMRPDSVRDWIQYSEDKRTNSGWYIGEAGGEYIVGYLGDEAGKKSKKLFKDRIGACAYFVKMEIEEVRRRF